MPDRDRFVLSKGHAALALYAALHACGRSRARSSTPSAPTERLSRAIPSTSLAGIDFSTGSLGHGCRSATGAALAARLQGSRAACIRRAQRRRDATRGRSGRRRCSPPTTGSRNLVAIVDVNGQQALGYTRDVLDLEPLGERWRSFGWDVQRGRRSRSSTNWLRRSIEPRGAARPTCCSPATIFGKGVSFMEQRDRVALPADVRRRVRHGAAASW